MSELNKYEELTIEKQMNSVGGKRLDLQIMRILACFLVIFNHLPGYMLYQTSGGIAKTWCCMFLTMFTRINVPLFFMISGTLLLTERKEGYKSILKNRVSRMVYLIIIFTFFIYLVTCIKSGKSFEVSSYIQYVIGESSEIGGTAYWYLYAYTGFLLMLPLLRKITANMTKSDFVFIITVHIIFFSLVPIINIFFSALGMKKIVISREFISVLNLLINVKALFYPLVGYYIDRKIDINKIRMKEIIYLYLIMFAGVLLSCVCTYYEGIYGGKGFTQNYVSLFDYVTAICVFLLIKYVCSYFHNFEKYKVFTRGLIQFGGLTMGIYLLDPIWKRLFYYDKFLVIINGIGVSTMIGTGLWCIISMFLGGIVTAILKQIPVVKKLF